MNYLLQNVINGGTGGGARGYSKLPTFAKTGTADASNDLWFVGGSPYYVGSVWYGFDKSERINAAAAAQRIWVAVMKDVHKDLEYKDFDYSNNVVKSLIVQKQVWLLLLIVRLAALGIIKRVTLLFARNTSMRSPKQVRSPTRLRPKLPQLIHLHHQAVMPITVRAFQVLLLVCFKQQ